MLAYDGVRSLTLTSLRWRTAMALPLSTHIHHVAPETLVKSWRWGGGVHRYSGIQTHSVCGCVCVCVRAHTHNALCGWVWVFLTSVIWGRKWLSAEWWSWSKWIHNTKAEVEGSWLSTLSVTNHAVTKNQSQKKWKPCQRAAFTRTLFSLTEPNPYHHGAISAPGTSVQTQQELFVGVFDFYFTLTLGHTDWFSPTYELFVIHVPLCLMRAIRVAV